MLTNLEIFVILFIERKEREVIKMLRILEILFTIAYLTVCVAIVIWIGISYADILAHNLHTGYDYPNWNFFTIFIE